MQQRPKDYSELQKKRKKVIVAALNWGLGHAARCIPIINELENKGVEVLIASDGFSLCLLKKEFPGRIFISLPGYNINYKGKSFAWSMMRQMPNAIRTYYREHKKISKIVNDNKIDAIISDCRYGCFCKGISNTIVSHQVNGIYPVPLLDKPLNALNYWFISKFQYLWIPDFEGLNNLTGRLGHEHNFDCEYIGILSRMKKTNEKKKYDIGIVLSGPEPQRSIFEKAIIDQVEQLENKNIILVQGLPGTKKKIDISRNLKVVSYMTSGELNKVMLKSNMIVARSGYSTIMDLWKLQKPALLIPTPGQTEQIYLAKQLEAKGLFMTQNQNQLNLKKAISEITNYKGFTQQTPISSLSNTIENFLNRI